MVSGVVNCIVFFSNVNINNDKYTLLPPRSRRDYEMLRICHSFNLSVFHDIGIAVVLMKMII